MENFAIWYYLFNNILCLFCNKFPRQKLSLHCTKKWKFSIRDFCSKCDLVTFTEENLNGKRFLCVCSVFDYLNSEPGLTSKKEPFVKVVRSFQFSVFNNVHYNLKRQTRLSNWKAHHLLCQILYWRFRCCKQTTLLVYSSKFRMLL